MDIRRLEMFSAVVEHGTFTRAAAAMFVSQPGLSKAVQELEHELGVRLFDRVGRRVLLTAAGRALVGPARNVLRDVEVCRESVGAVAGLERGFLDLACLPTLAADPTADLIGRFRIAHPGVQVTLAAPDDPADLAAMVRQGEVEIGIGDEPDARSGFVVHHLDEQDLLAVMPPGTARPDGEAITLRELVAQPLVVTPRGTSSREVLDAAIAASGESPTFAVETAQREAILPLVLTGAGVGLLPRPVAELAARLGAVVVATRPVFRRRVAAFHRATPRSPAGEAFLALL